MPSLSTARRVSSAKNNNAKTLGQIRKENSDTAMELLWDSDPQSKVCYIYDWRHDDSPNMNVGMTYNHTTKTRIDAKIIVSTYGSISKDQPTLQCQFKPSQKEYFDETDELFYMEEYRVKYQMDDIFTGMYLDVPDKKNVYHRHLICMKDIEQNFQKYFILPCDYNLQWVQFKNNEKIKRSMWCVLRSQSSYNSGLWTDLRFTTQQNQEILFIPTNSISDTIYYVSEGSQKNQLIIVDVPNYSIDHWTPNTWIVSKVERVNVKGRTKITLYQTFFDEHRDVIEKDDNGNIIGMWANLNDSILEPTEKPEIHSPLLPPEHSATISSSTPYIKVGGSYKTLTFKSENESTNYENCTFVWTCSIDGTSVDDKVTKINGKNPNQKKIKFPNDSSQLGKKLSIKCTMTNSDGTIETGEVQLELSE
jgi:hypothetical protein